MHDVSTPVPMDFDLYPSSQPYVAGNLPVDDVHVLAYEQHGNPEGLPVVVLHGGPGAGCSPEHPRFFDPVAYRIVLFDQRGAGKSTPSGSLDNNTTMHLVRDIEALRLHLGIDRWVIFGGSWGSLLAMAYAAAHADVCLALILRGIWLCRPSDLTWWFDGIRGVYPDHWKTFVSPIAEEERHDLLGAYRHRLMDPDPAVHRPAAQAWGDYETACSTLLGKGRDLELAADRTVALARIEAHYLHHLSFLRENELLDAVERFSHLPGTIVHGRYDMLCFVDAAFALAARWPKADLVVVPDAGHSALEPGIRRALVVATNRFRDSLRSG
jgi:proline iminopeptidase